MRLKMILPLLLISFFMTACGPQIIIETVRVDESLLDCEDRPPVPENPVTNEQDALWKNDITFAHADCKSKLTRIAEIQAEVEK